MPLTWRLLVVWTGLLVSTPELLAQECGSAFTPDGRKQMTSELVATRADGSEETDKDEFENLLATLDDCLGSEGDPEWPKSVKPLNDWKGWDGTFTAARATAVEQEALSLITSLEYTAVSASPLQAEVDQDIGAARDAMMTDQFGSEFLRPLFWDIKPQGFTVGNPPALGINLNLYNDVFLPACPAGQSQPTEACLQAIEEMAAALRLANIMEQVLIQLKIGKLGAIRQQLNENSRRWDYYFLEAREQYWWEIQINSALIERKERNRQGFLPVPNYQWIVLHPSVAFELVDAAAAGSQTQPAALLEWAGYNRWAWDGSAWGASLISSYSDRAGVSDLGHGILIHYNHDFSVGVTTRDGSDIGILLSFNPAKLLQTNQRFKESKTKFFLGLESTETE